MNDEIREWEAQNAKHKVAFMLVSDGVSFHYNEEDSIMSSVPESYVKNMVYRLVARHSCSSGPVVAEY